MKEQDASDLHLSPNSPPIVRVDGIMRRTKLPSLNPEDVHLLIYDIMNDYERKIYEEEKEIDFAYDFLGIGRFRVNVFQGFYGDTAVLRAISSRIYSFEELQLPESFKDLANMDKGLILVTGPTGSGKSTTLSTIIDYINSHSHRHIITLEDPLEYIHKSKKSLVNHREIGTNSKSFSKALRSALREDPDVIVVGEMRDLETTSLAITAAETGHLVFGTLHTMSAPKTIDRIIDQYPSDRQSQIRIMLSESVAGVISQVLLPKIGGGRVAAFEVLIGNPAVGNLIRESKTYQLASVMQTSSRLGMQTMEQHFHRLIVEGIVEKNSILSVAGNNEELRKAINSI